MNTQERQQQKSLGDLYEVESGLLARIKTLQADPKSSIADIERLLKSHKLVSDQIVTREWVAALRETITSNPSLSLPPGMGQGSTARKLQALRQQQQRREHRDQRRGENRPPLPPPDFGFSLPGDSRPVCGDGITLPGCDSHPPGTPHPKR